MLENLYTANNYVLSKKMLDASHIRHEALSNNIANVETPNYKRRDLPATFEKEELNEAVERGDKVRLEISPCEPRLINAQNQLDSMETTWSWTRSFWKSTATP